ncbi:hypothetical protein JOD45_001452 [Scopulibacillus daqui]|uniref:Uncharacterized protein n=1 Tax=Scopulibacillus daqui TaxID=1469162 RepID=A0ABS2PYW3_9BACL|nr:hypothetical protein [Scopulibacillus daqui]MBM7645241.1 hypothetical protein [Scopulibacillus daqui]
MKIAILSWFEELPSKICQKAMIEKAGLENDIRPLCHYAFLRICCTS